MLVQAGVFDYGTMWRWGFTTGVGAWMVRPPVVGSQRAFFRDTSARATAMSPAAPKPA
jgi:hypothetical protein